LILSVSVILLVDIGSSGSHTVISLYHVNNARLVPSPPHSKCYKIDRLLLQVELSNLF